MESSFEFSGDPPLDRFCFSVRAEAPADRRPVVNALRARRRIVWGAAVLVLILLLAGWKWGIPHYALRQVRADLASQQYLAALEWLPGATKAEPAEGHFLHARVARKLGDYEEMARQLEAAAKHGAARTRVELELLLAEAQRGRLAPLESQLGTLLAEGRDPAEVCEAYVQGCLLNYRLDDALRILQLWQADYPQDARPHLLRGRILEHRTNFPGAKREFAKALEKNPRDAAAAYNLARNLISDHKPQQAIELYRRCAEFLGNPQPGLIGEAHCHRLLGDLDRAERLLEQARAAPDKFLDAAYRLVGEPSESAAAKLSAEFGLLALEQKDYPRAVEHLQRAIESNPKDWRNRYQLGIALRQAGRREEAAEHLKIVSETNQALSRCDLLIAALQKDPADAEARFVVGQTFLKYVSEKQGLVWLNSVLKYAPDHRGAHALLEEYFRTHQDENPEYAALARYHHDRLTDLSGEMVDRSK